MRRSRLDDWSGRRGVAYPDRVITLRQHRGAPRLRRILLLAVTAFAVLVMHAAGGSHCGIATAQSQPSMSHQAHASAAGHHSTMSASEGVVVEKAGATMDCAMAASCTFVLPGGAAIVVVAILVLLAYGPRDLFVRLVIPRRVVLGRPPPWAIPSHLRLGVLLR